MNMLIEKNGGLLEHSADVAVQRGVAGRAREMRAIASRLPPHTHPW
jgi:hypothetical protein